MVTYVTLAKKGPLEPPYINQDFENMKNYNVKLYFLHDTRGVYLQYSPALHEKTDGWNFKVCHIETQGFIENGR